MAIDAAPLAVPSNGKPAEPTPAPVLSDPAPQPSTVQTTIKEPTPRTSLNEAYPKQSISADTMGTADPPFSPSSTTPVLEKEELDFAGNVDVNDDIPSEKDLTKVGDLLILDAKGQSRPFKDLYQGAGVAPRQLIIFIRHFFCGNCQEYLRTLSSSITPESLLALPTPAFITVIGCGKPELIPMYAEATNCPFQIYADPTRKLYDYLHMTRTFDLGSKPGYIHSNLLITSVQSIIQGLKTGNKALKGGDFKQVGGEFLFENGQCVRVHRMRNTRDHLEVEQVRVLLGLDGVKPPLRKRWSHSIKHMKEGRTRSSSWGRVRSKSRGAKEQEVGKTPEDAQDPGKLVGRPTI
ncbi:AhpC/TSA antioxidant enzyme-domain-containing protein [Massariosphaeria phaeospora]|uniref:AhpC/TSA antioxidant enzyme-domain-containing protein n=1 Tax=Massariosphaeria phaeospora TaxID=100035 RepID=A0A7C8I2H9_9PLEO|nr:AhpC/TSA antioxidant enzyme-domain-containing protein [Massariosphaeria phaeospora]